MWSKAWVGLIQDGKKAALLHSGLEGSQLAFIPLGVVVGKGF
jgi:hypothetical protein